MNFNHLLMAILFSTLAIVGLIGQNWQHISPVFENVAWLYEGADQVHQLKTPESMMDYILENPEKVSIAAYRLDRPEHGLFLNADQKRPLASTMKILVLAEYARQVSLGMVASEERARLEDVELFYLPWTDGGAHALAVRDFKEKGYIDSQNTVLLEHIVFAMIRYSDNAATDFMLTRLGKEHIEALPALLGLSQQDAVMPLAGMFLSWNNHRLKNPPLERLKHYQSMTQVQYADEVNFWTNEWINNEAFRAAELDRLKQQGLGISSKHQQAFSSLAPKGTAREYADIMARIYSGELISAEVSEIMAEFLGWPMAISSTVQENFDVFGTKGGNLAGVLTATYFARSKGASDGTVLSVFYENLEGAVWFDLARNVLHQQLELNLMQDATLFELFKEKLFPLGD